MVSGTDMGFYLSGGIGNTNAYASLGGEPSAHPLLTGLNNLFENINKNDVFSDYRCVYVYNNHATDSINNLQVLIKNKMADATTIEIGIPLATDQQIVTITNAVSAGSYTLIYDSSDVVVNYDADVSIWATNLQNALNALLEVTGAIVTYTYYASPVRYEFIVSFEGIDDHKQHPLLTVKTNNLTPVGTAVTIVTDKIANGAPINNIASPISCSTVSPTGITFVSTAVGVGTLYHGDGFPVWIKRSLLGDGTVVTDSFTLYIEGNS
jgi:hypothetical protein